MEKNKHLKVNLEELENLSTYGGADGNTPEGRSIAITKAAISASKVASKAVSAAVSKSSNANPLTCVGVATAVASCNRTCGC